MAGEGREATGASGLEVEEERGLMAEGVGVEEEEDGISTLVTIPPIAPGIDR